MKNPRPFLIAACALLGVSVATTPSTFAGDTPKSFRAGAHLVDISPTNFPVLVNAMFTERSATTTVDPLYVKSLVLDDGSTRIAMAVVDTCMMSRDLIDRAKD